MRPTAGLWARTILSRPWRIVQTLLATAPYVAALALGNYRSRQSGGAATQPLLRGTGTREVSLT
ncbi:hypothetical protein [Paenarthrobacter sp. 2TAF44]|uniref:hypothetical protein n=1 Tax=Paenarthrobacter sp. 2TAF44 TaxID=3233018 RepID=UPI003F9CB89A